MVVAALTEAQIAVGYIEKVSKRSCRRDSSSAVGTPAVDSGSSVVAPGSFAGWLGNFVVAIVVRIAMDSTPAAKESGFAAIELPKD